MSAVALRVASPPERSRVSFGVPLVSAFAVASGALLHSVPTVVLALAPLAIWVVIYAPEALLVLLASQGTLKAVLPFSALPVNMLYVALGLVGIACLLRVRRYGLPPIPLAAGLMVLLMAFLLVAAIRGASYPGGTYKAIYFELVCGTLFFAPFVLIRNVAGVVRLAAAFVIVGLIVAHAATPGPTPEQPYTLPGGNEITAAYYPAIGALAALTCLAMRRLGVARVAGVVVAAVLGAAAVRTGSRGVLAASLLAGGVSFALLIFYARRPVLAIGLAVVAIAAAFVGGREVVGASALQRYSVLTTDTRRAFLRDRAFDQALAHPLGSGIGAYGDNIPVLNPLPEVPYPHNIVLEVFDEGGELALGVLAALVVAAFVAGFRVARRPGLAFCAAGVTFALVESFASGSVNDNGVLWLLLGVTFAAVNVFGVRAAEIPDTT